MSQHAARRHWRTGERALLRVARVPPLAADARRHPRAAAPAVCAPNVRKGVAAWRGVRGCRARASTNAHTQGFHYDAPSHAASGCSAVRHCALVPCTTLLLLTARLRPRATPGGCGI
eukprot:7384550-Prymnesium_polylepis.2